MDMETTGKNHKGVRLCTRMIMPVATFRLGDVYCNQLPPHMPFVYVTNKGSPVYLGSWWLQARKKGLGVLCSDATKHPWIYCNKGRD